MNQNYTLNEFDFHYSNIQHRAERFSSNRFYHDKTPFEDNQKQYTSEDEDDPAWMSDGGRGEREMMNQVAYDLDGEDIEGSNSYLSKKIKAALQRVKRRHPECLETLKLIFKNGSNRNKSICELMKSKMRG